MVSLGKSCVLAVLLILVIILLCMYNNKASASEHYPPALPVRSDYPALIYDGPSYLPQGADRFINYPNPVPTSLPPHLVQGTFHPPRIDYEVQNYQPSWIM